MSQPLRIAVNGAAGRMGQRIVALARQDADLRVVAALESRSCPQLGRDAGAIAGIGDIGVLISTVPETPVDVVIDFSTPEGTAAITKLCRDQRLAAVLATTGLNSEQRAEVAAAAQVIPLVSSPSMSVAVNLAMKLVRDAARALKPHSSGVDVEIIERHHRFKEDAPSGTALKFGEIVAEEMGQTKHMHGRHGRIGARPRHEIGYHALRTGDNVGEHTIVFGMLGETIDLTVRGHTRDSYAYGALAAAKFVATQPPGLYSMSDVLGL